METRILRTLRDLRTPLLAWFLVLGAVCLPARCAEPRAAITGPLTGAVGEKLLFDVSGSATDKEYPLRIDIASSGDKPTTRLWFDEHAKPGLLVLKADRPGYYTIVLVAIGRADGGEIISSAIATWPVTIGGPSPEPVEPDTPTPNPTPPSPPVTDYDPVFVPIGKQYAATLATDFAKALASGRKLTGQSRTMKSAAIAKEFSANRQASFDAIVTPALSRLIPSNVTDDKMTIEQLLAFDRALAGLQKGVSGK